jgi:hypothetical protein
MNRDTHSLKRYPDPQITGNNPAAIQAIDAALGTSIGAVDRLRPLVPASTPAVPAAMRMNVPAGFTATRHRE